VITAIASAAATVILSNIVILLSSEPEMALPTRSLDAGFIPTSVGWSLLEVPAVHHNVLTPASSLNHTTVNISGAVLITK
jgi:hypothetical protein